MNSAAVRATIDEMVKNKVAMTSTLAIYELYVPGRPAELDPRMLEAMSPETREEYLTSRKRIAENPATGTPEAVFKKAMQFDRMFVQAGGLLAAGSDPTGNGGALPGFGDQRNHELLVEAGFSPAESIRIMTLNGAKVLGVDKELGSVEAGKIADLVVILLFAVALALVARGWFTDRGWQRAPTIVWHLLLFPVGVSLLQAEQALLGWLVLLVALGTLLAALAARQDPDEDAGGPAAD